MRETPNFWTASSDGDQKKMGPHRIRRYDIGATPAIRLDPIASGRLIGTFIVQTC